MQIYEWLERRKQFIYQFTGRPWYPGLISVLAGLDLFVIIVPTDAFLVSAVLAKPRRWLAIALTIALGSSLGAAILALLVHFDKEVIVQFFPTFFQSTNWAMAERWLTTYGIGAMFFAAIGPLPLQPFVVAGALSPLSLESIIISLTIGRVLKFIFFSWCASHAPRLLGKFLR